MILLWHDSPSRTLGMAFPRTFCTVSFAIRIRSEAAVWPVIRLPSRVNPSRRPNWNLLNNLYRELPLLCIGLEAPQELLSFDVKGDLLGTSFAKDMGAKRFSRASRFPGSCRLRCYWTTANSRNYRRCPIRATRKPLSLRVHWPSARAKRRPNLAMH